MQNTMESFRKPGEASFFARVGSRKQTEGESSKNKKEQTMRRDRSDHHWKKKGPCDWEEVDRRRSLNN